MRGAACLGPTCRWSWVDAARRERGLKQVDAAKLIGIKQPDVSKMPRGESRQFSVERVTRILFALGQDVEIVVKPHRDATVGPALKVARTSASPTETIVEAACELRSRLDRKLRVIVRFARSSFPPRRE